MSAPGGTLTVMPMTPSPESQADPLRPALDEVRARLFAALASDAPNHEDGACGGDS